MTCSCPKCAARVQVDISHIPEEGTYAPCPECNKRFWINKESFARRIFKKEGKIYCVQCGNELGPLTACPACGVTFPDYCAVLTAKPARRQMEKTGFSVSFSPKQVKQSSYAVHHKSTAKSSKSLLIRVGLIVLIAALALGIGIFYQYTKAEQQYAANFARAVYGIKTGTGLSLNACTKISADWKAKTDMGQNFVPRIDPADDSRLKNIQDEVDRIMQKLNKPPPKFGKANEKLANLYGTSAKVQSLAFNPSGSLSGFTDAATKAESDYRHAVQELKANLPTELSGELEKAKKKYKGLQDF